MNQVLKTPGPNKIQRWPPYPRFEEPEDWALVVIVKLSFMLGNIAIFVLAIYGIFSKGGVLSR